VGFSGLNNTQECDTAIIGNARGISLDGNVIRDFHKGMLLKCKACNVNNNIFEAPWNANENIRYNGWGIHTVGNGWKAQGGIKGQGDFYHGRPIGGSDFGHLGPYSICGNVFDIATNMSKTGDDDFDPINHYPMSALPNLNL